MVEAAGRVVEALVGEKVDVDAALGFVHLSDLGRGDIRVSGELHDEDKQGEGMQQKELSGHDQRDEERKMLSQRRSHFRCKGRLGSTLPSCYSLSC